MKRIFAAIALQVRQSLSRSRSFGSLNHHEASDIRERDERWARVPNHTSQIIRPYWIILPEFT